MSHHREKIAALVERYPDLPPEAIYKEDVLRQGLSFSEDALRIATGFKPKAYFIFSFDLVPISEMQSREHFRVPEEVSLLDGKEGFRRVIVSVRVNPSSPYRVELAPDGRLILVLEGEEVCAVQYPEVPEYYRHQLSSGKPITDIAPTIEWGYLLYLTVFRLPR